MQANSGACAKPITAVEFQVRAWSFPQFRLCPSADARLVSCCGHWTGSTASLVHSHEPHSVGILLPRTWLRTIITNDLLLISAYDVPLPLQMLPWTLTEATKLLDLADDRILVNTVMMEQHFKATQSAQNLTIWLHKTAAYQPRTLVQPVCHS